MVPASRFSDIMEQKRHQKSVYTLHALDDPVELLEVLKTRRPQPLQVTNCEQGMFIDSIHMIRFVDHQLSQDTKFRNEPPQHTCLMHLPKCVVYALSPEYFQKMMDRRRRMSRSSVYVQKCRPYL